MGFSKLLIFLSLFSLLLSSGCIEEPTVQQAGPASAGASDDEVEVPGDVRARAGIFFSYTHPEILSLGAGFSYSATSLPSWADIDSSTGMIYGVPTIAQTYLNVSITAVKGAITSDIGPFSIGVDSDPLTAHAWHLKNTGQNNFATFSALPGKDLNLEETIKFNTTGKDIKIAISDSGVELNHPDLEDNSLLNLSKDYSLAAPYFGYPTPSSAHGTAVAGIAAAVGWNNIGSRGVAPEAEIIGLQFLNSLQDTAILIDQASGAIDVFNYSYGDATFSDVRSDDDYLDQIRYQATIGGRSGLGSVFVKAAGNEDEIIRNNFLGVSKAKLSHNANLPLENESPYMIIVGALDAQGEKAYYSNRGSNLWISGYGGDFGLVSPALMTTDLTTCSQGYSKASEALNDFEFGHALNPNCNYTSTMNGTSGAVPMVSGAVALIMQANPFLKARDIKDILARTAKVVQPTYSLNHPTSEFNLTSHSYELGWVTNAAGFSFSNLFGFGAIDVDAAISLAQDINYEPLGTAIELNSSFTDANYRKTISKAIPDNSASGVSDSLYLNDELTAESVQIEITIDHDKSGELGIELTSPSGTKSILLNVNNSLLLSGDKNISNLVLTSNAFYGESTKGVWTLKVIDGMSGNTGTLKEWNINILGH